MYDVIIVSVVLLYRVVENLNFLLKFEWEVLVGYLLKKKKSFVKFIEIVIVGYF